MGGFLIELLPLLLPLILDCIQTDGEQQTMANMRRGGPLVQFRIYRQLQAQPGIGRLKARQMARDAVADLRKASDDDLQALIRDAQAGE